MNSISGLQDFDTSWTSWTSACLCCSSNHHCLAATWWTRRSPRASAHSEINVTNINVYISATMSGSQCAVSDTETNTTTKIQGDCKLIYIRQHVARDIVTGEVKTAEQILPGQKWGATKSIRDSKSQQQFDRRVIIIFVTPFMIYTITYKIKTIYVLNKAVAVIGKPLIWSS